MKKLEIERTKPVEHDLGRDREHLPCPGKMVKKLSQDMSWSTAVPGKWDVMR